MPLLLFLNEQTKDLLICGESSGDAYGAQLATALSTQTNATLYSIGGPQLSTVTHQLFRMNTSAHSVSFDGFGYRRTNKRLLSQQIPAFIRDYNIDAAVIIDFPTLNFFIASLIQPFSIPITTFITPNFWIWNQTKDAKKLANYSTNIITIFKREYDFYRNICPEKLHYFGHPLTIQNQDLPPKQPIINNHHIGIFPGSRHSEVTQHLPV